MRRNRNDAALSRGSGFRCLVIPVFMLLLTPGHNVALAQTAPSQPAQSVGQPARLVFECQKHTAGRISQAYSIKVFDDGLALYKGESYVKTVGAVPIRISQEAIAELHSIILRFGPATYVRRENPYPERWVVMFLTDEGIVTIHHSSASFPDPRLSDFFRNALERLIPTRDLRCPFVMTFPSMHAGTDVCAQ